MDTVRWLPPEVAAAARHRRVRARAPGMAVGDADVPRRFEMARPTLGVSKDGGPLFSISVSELKNVRLHFRHPTCIEHFWRRYLEKIFREDI